MLVRVKGVHHVKRKLADGTYRHHYYAWRGGPKIKAKPHAPEFVMEVARLRELAAREPTLTLDSLIDRFTGTDHEPNPDWLALAETTRRDHLYAFRLIRKKWPRLPLHLTQEKGMKDDIRKWHRSFAQNPRKADKLLFSLSKLFSYGIACELIDKNPCHGITRLYKGSRRDFIWTPDLIRRFRENAPSHLLLPFEIAIATGQRQSDILGLSWRDYDGTYLRFHQSKTGKKLKVRVHSRLKAMLDAMPKDTLRICLNSRGRPWTKDGFKTSWGKECDKLGITDVTFHDLRGTFITERWKEGNDIKRIALISGHSIGEVTTILERHYLSPDQEDSDAVILRMERNHP